MSIATMDELVAGFLPPYGFHKYSSANENITTAPFSSWYMPGVPGAASAPSPGINGEALTGPSVSGQLGFPAAVGGDNIYLAQFAVTGNDQNSIFLLDRLWQNSGIVVTTTTAQSITPVAIPARDRNGSSNGVGVFAAIEVSTATTNGAAVTNTTISYTNSAGTAGRTGTIASFPATAVAGTFVPFELQAGDLGVRSIESITLGTSYGGGAIHLVLFRQIAISVVTASLAGENQGVTDLGLPRLYDASVPFLMFRSSTTTAKRYVGQLTYSQN